MHVVVYDQPPGTRAEQNEVREIAFLVRAPSEDLVCRQGHRPGVFPFAGVLGDVSRLEYRLIQELAPPLVNRGQARCRCRRAAPITPAILPCRFGSTSCREMEGSNASDISANPGLARGVGVAVFARRSRGKKLKITGRHGPKRAIGIVEDGIPEFKKRSLEATRRISYD